MRGDKILDTRNITRDTKKYLTNYAKAYATIASEDLTLAAKEYIDKFYADYSPTVYDRTFNFQKNSYKKIFEANSAEFVGGVILNWENMFPYTKKWNAIHEKNLTTIEPWVIWEDAMNGYHGPENSPYLPKVMTPSPRELINKYFESNGTLNNKKYAAYAKKYADSQRYSTFGF